MTLAMAGSRRDAGVSVAEVNLTHIWDVVNQIRVGGGGRAYVVDARGRLIAHPEISLVLRNTDVSQLAQVQSGRARPDIEEAQIAYDLKGERVLAAHAMATPLNWLVVVEIPESEANAPLYAIIARTVVVLVAGLALALLAALLLARLMMVPVQALAAGAARIGAGALDHRIEIKTGDELEALGEQLNDMAAKLQGSYATLERKVEERTQQLHEANLSKSRFLAAASHDLRQPLHALNLFAAQLRSEKDPLERDRLAGRIDTAVANMNELFNALLDISKLEAGAMRANISDFPVSRVLNRIGAMFTAAARDKGLHLRVVPAARGCAAIPSCSSRSCSIWSPTPCAIHRLAASLSAAGTSATRCDIDVCDSGIGIAADQQRSIFGEFYQVAAPERSKGRVGAGPCHSGAHARPCWSTPSRLRRRSGKVRASRSRCRRCRPRAVPSPAAAAGHGAARSPARQAHRGDRRRCVGAGRDRRPAQELGLPRHHRPVGSRGADEAQWQHAGPDHLRLSPAGGRIRHRCYRRASRCVRRAISRHS